MIGNDITVTLKVVNNASRAFYDALIELTPWDQAAPSDELTRAQDLSRTGWCTVHKGMFKPAGHYDRARLVKSGICAECDSWIELWKAKDEPNVVRINGQHYMFGNHLQDARITQETTIEQLAKAFKTNSAGKGMGGQCVLIRMKDGRNVITDDLWHQGKVPAAYELVLEDNAEALEFVA